MKLVLAPEQIAELNVIRSAFSGREVRGTFPDFLVLGPQRTGTTWLHAQLERHPAIYLSFPKELYFFSRLQHGERRVFSRHFEAFDMRGALSRRHFHRVVRDIAKILYFDILKTGTLPAYSIEWYLRFFDEPARRKLRKERECQRMYGEPYQPMVFGEATASYAVLDEVVIEDILKVNPKLKGILVIRDPVERAWSHAKKDLMLLGNRSLKQIRDQEFLDFFTDQYQVDCANYIQQIYSWKKHLARGGLLVCFYDEIHCRPDMVLMEVFKFLGVEAAAHYISADVHARINPTMSVGIPGKFKHFLEEMFADQRRKLEAEFDRKWPWM